MTTMLKWLFGLVVLCGLALAGLVFILTRPAAPLAPAPLIVEVDQGRLQGGIDAENSEILQFNGIPYAAAPIGDLRWRAPQAHGGWEGVRAAQAFGAECLQARIGSSQFTKDIVKGLGLAWWKQQLASLVTTYTPAPEESEDCLFLNVRTANVGGETAQPVMVWIHGGSHQTGSGSNAVYQANQLVDNGVVLVTINYRLGPLGYLAHPALSAEDPRGVSGNYGLLDQMAALKWVRANIAAFGGDPENITVFGESAGAQSISEIMAASGGDGLFHKAILQSGSSTYRSVGLNTALDARFTAHDAGRIFLSNLVGEGADAADLRKIAGDDIIATLVDHPDLFYYFKPVVDGEVLPRMVGDAIMNGHVPAIPMLAGYNADEATLFYAGTQSPTLIKWPFPESPAERVALLDEIYGAADAEILRDLYGLHDPSNWDKGATDMLGDDLFGVHMRLLGRLNAESGAPTWLYHFDRVPPSPRQTLGAFHASEIFFVFDSHNPLMDLTEHDRRLTAQLGAYWTNFAKTGNPNGAGLPEWPAYGADDQWIILRDQIATGRVRPEKLDVLERAVTSWVYAAVPVLTPPQVFASSGEQAGAESLEP